MILTFAFMVDFLRAFFRVCIIIVIFLSVGPGTIAQKLSYPAGYYQFPIRPNLANSLAGGLGDLRSNHFHAGLDIRTEQREGLPVYAAAEGYVYKVAIQRSGYGNVIFLRHPNGQTSVYGHLLKFSKALADYVRSEQYKKQSFEIDLFPNSGQFRFRKGEVIGLSGNTGGSAGPHLHFEIRDSKDNYLNPLYFGFKEIRDVTPPKFVGVALRPLDLNARVNRQFERKVFLPERLKDGSYRIKGTITATGLLGLDLMAHDLMTGTGFRYGLQCIEIKVDGNEIFSYNMEMFPNAATRDYNNLIDYETEQRSGQRYLKCYVPDGNVFDLYKTGPHNGKLYISDTLTHEVRIRLSDSYENASELTFFIKGESDASQALSFQEEKDTEWMSTEIRENILMVKAKSYRSAMPVGTFYTKGREIKKYPDYFSEESAVFLFDLRTSLPDSVTVGRKTAKTNLCKQILPGVPDQYRSENWSVEFTEKSLFDTLFVTGQRSYNALIVSQEWVALRDYAKISFAPEDVPTDQARNHIYRYVNGDFRFLGGLWKGDRIEFETRELGTFVVRPDTVGPRIRLLEHSKTSIRGYIWDGMSGIDQFSAQVNGEWVLLNYDAKKGYVWSEKADVAKTFEGELSLRVTDRAGNSTILRVGIVEPALKKRAVKGTKNVNL
jgi:hypothetical protein